jgi:hypothetical protein
MPTEPSLWFIWTWRVREFFGNPFISEAEVAFVTLALVGIPLLFVCEFLRSRRKAKP